MVDQKIMIKETGQTLSWPLCESADCPNLVFMAAWQQHGVKKCYPCSVQILGKEICEGLRDMLP